MMRRPIDHTKREQEDRDHQDCGTLIMREKRQGEGTFLPPVPLESSVVLARDYLLTYCSPIMGVMIYHSMLDWTIQRQLRLSTRGGWLIALILWISAGTPLNNPRIANSEYWTRSPPPDKGCGRLSLFAQAPRSRWGRDEPLRNTNCEGAVCEQHSNRRDCWARHQRFLFWGIFVCSQTGYHSYETVEKVAILRRKI